VWPLVRIHLGPLACGGALDEAEPVAPFVAAAGIGAARLVRV
jgi:hypothetical protein